MAASGVAFAVAAALLAGPALAEPVRFAVIDHLSPGQSQEDIAVFVDNRLVASLHIDRDHADDRAEILLERADRYEFALCGRLVRDDPATEHRIDDGGTLTDVEGRTFAAFTVGDKLFTLEDVTPGRLRTAVTAHPGSVCAPAVASR